MTFQCRLCSSDAALISLFNGKCRKNRDYIRKLVEITTGIKYEKDDRLRYICYACTVQVYNFYIFRIRSIENQDKLKDFINDKTKKKSNKIEIPNLDNIEVPDIESVLESLGSWLKSKLPHLLSGKDCNENGNLDNSIGINTTSDSSTQKDTACIYDRSVQCNITKKTSNKGVQCNLLQTYDRSVQCSISKESCDKVIQSDLILVFDKYIQCVVPITESHTQTNSVLTKSGETQCNLPENIEEQSQRENKNVTTQTYPSNEDKSIQNDGIGNSEYDDKDCHFQYEKVVNIKHELPTPPPSSLGESPYFSSINHEEISSPIETLTVLNRSQNVTICSECSQTFYSKNSYILHKRIHLVCRYCKQKFSRIKRAKWHMEHDCTAKKIEKLEPTVQLIRLENSKDLLEKYPVCLNRLKKKEKSGVVSAIRLRSRSMSTTDSFYNKCCFCRSSVSVLRELKVGVDKSSQTNLLADRWIFSDFFFKGRFSTKKEVCESTLPPAKRRKLSK